MRALIDAVRDYCQWALAQGGETAPVFQALVEHVDWQTPIREQPPQWHPVLDAHLQEACDLAASAGEPGGAVASAVYEMRERLHWHTIYQQYDDEPDMAAFRRGYTFADVIGPEDPLPSDSVYLGITLQGPDRYYPPHAHRAREAYAVLGGTGDWKRGIEPWTSKPPGSLIYHAGGMRHAMQSNAEPILALAVWPDHLDGRVVIVRG